MDTPSVCCPGVLLGIQPQETDSIDIQLTFPEHAHPMYVRGRQGSP